MNNTKVAEDCMTEILHKTLLGGNVVGVLVDWDEDGQKYYGLRITIPTPKPFPNKYNEYAVWFICDFEGNGPGGFQIQKLS